MTSSPSRWRARERTLNGQSAVDEELISRSFAVLGDGHEDRENETW